MENLPYKRFYDLPNKTTPYSAAVSNELQTQIKNDIHTSTSLSEARTKLDLENVLPKVAGSGTNIQLNDTTNYDLLLKLCGNANQLQTTGKNILPVTNQDFTLNGIRFKAQDGVIKVNGIVTENITGFIMKNNNMFPVTLPAGTYYLSRNTTNCTIGLIKAIDDSVVVQLSSSNPNLFYSSFTLQQETNLYLYFYIPSGSTINFGEFKVMISTSDNTEFEPYTGGKPSPSLEYPQNFRVVASKNNIIVNNKNYFNGEYDTYNYSAMLPTTTTSSIVINSYDSNNFDASWTGTNYSEVLAKPIQLEPNTQYTLSFNRIDSNNASPRNYVYSLNNGVYSLITSKNVTGNVSITFTTTASGLAAFGFGLPNNSRGANVKVNNIQIEKGNVATLYEPIKTQVYPVNLSKNLFDVNKVVVGSLAAENGKIIGVNTLNTIRACSFYSPIPVKPNTTYTVSFNSNFLTAYFECDNQMNILVDSGWKTATTVFTTGPNTKKLLFNIKLNSESQIDLMTLKNSIELQVEENSNATPYEKYDKLVLVKINDDADYFVKNLNTGIWFKYNVIGKKVLDGSETIKKITTVNNKNAFYIQINNVKNFDASYVGKNILSDKLINRNMNDIYNELEGITPSNGDSSYYVSSVGIYTNATKSMTVEEFKTYLSLNNILIYYILNEPFNEEITDPILIEQLDAIAGAFSYKTQTNISEDNRELPFIIDAHTLYDLNLLIQRISELELG